MAWTWELDDGANAGHFLSEQLARPVHAGRTDDGFVVTISPRLVSWSVWVLWRGPLGRVELKAQLPLAWTVAHVKTWVETWAEGVTRASIEATAAATTTENGR